METWRVAQGSALPLTVPIADGTGTAIAYTGTETLAASLWIGNDQQPLLTLTPTWQTPSLGLTTLVFTAAQTQALAVGQYRLICTITDDTGTYDYYEALIAIAASPGAALARPTYCTAADLRKVCNWIDTVQDPETQETGFADQCADAREWFDENCLRNYTGGYVSLMGEHDVALNAWFGGGARKSLAHNIFIAQQLAQNHLIVSPRILKVNALYACSCVFMGNLNRNADYIKYAAMFRHQAYQLLCATVAEIDVTGAGTTPNIPITFSSANALFA